MVDNPFFPLSFIAGPAILMNACAVMQNGTNLRYGLAVNQLREFRSSVAAKDGKFHSLYTDPSAALKLAKRRVKLLLRGLNLIYASVAFFGLTTFIGLVGAFLTRTESTLTIQITALMVGAAGFGFFFLVSAVLTFVYESATARAMVRLHTNESDNNG